MHSLLGIEIRANLFAKPKQNETNTDASQLYRYRATAAAEEEKEEVEKNVVSFFFIPFHFLSYRIQLPPAKQHTARLERVRMNLWEL